MTKNPSYKKFREKFSNFNSVPNKPIKEEHPLKKVLPFELSEYRHYFFECIRSEFPEKDIQSFRDYILEELNVLYATGKISLKEKNKKYWSLFYYGHREEILDKRKIYNKVHREQSHALCKEYRRKHKNRISYNQRMWYINNMYEQRSKHLKYYYDNRNHVLRVKANQYREKRDRERLRILTNFTFD